MKLKLHQKWRLLKHGTIKKSGDEWLSYILQDQFVRRRVEVK